MKIIKIILIGAYAIFSIVPIISINYFLTGFLLRKIGLDWGYATPIQLILFILEYFMSIFWLKDFLFQEIKNIPGDNTGLPRSIQYMFLGIGIFILLIGYGLFILLSGA